MTTTDDAAAAAIWNWLQGTSHFECGGWSWDSGRLGELKCNCGEVLTMTTERERYAAMSPAERLAYLDQVREPLSRRIAVGHTPVTCPPSEVKDMIVRWQDVTDRDLVLQEDELVLPERVEISQDTWNRETGETFTRVDIYTRLDNGVLVSSEHHGDRLTAVRRYVTEV